MNRHSALVHFAHLFPVHDQQPTFRDPAQLLGWLQDRTVDAEAKNRFLARLLHAAAGEDCANDAAGDLAVELLLLALWPGLCVVRFRLQRLCHEGALDADLIGSLSLGIRAARPERVTRVAATLLRNLERDLRRAYIRVDRWDKLTSDLDASAYKLSAWEAERPETIIAAAHATDGDDGFLLAAVHIGGFTQKEAADMLGLTYDAARKRCQRTLARLTRHPDA